MRRRGFPKSFWRKNDKNRKISIVCVKRTKLLPLNAFEGEP